MLCASGRIPKVYCSLLSLQGVIGEASHGQAGMNRLAHALALALNRRAAWGGLVGRVFALAARQSAPACTALLCQRALRLRIVAMSSAKALSAAS